MKDFDKALEVVNSDCGNVLIVGGDCSGKSKVLEMITAYLLGKENIFAMSNSSKIRGMINSHPDSTYVYKSSGGKVNKDIIGNIEQKTVLVDEYPDINELISQLEIDKRIIMTYHAESLEAIPAIMYKYFPVIVQCKTINEQTKEKGISQVIYK